VTAPRIERARRAARAAWEAFRGERTQARWEAYLDACKAIKVERDRAADLACEASAEAW